MRPDQARALAAVRAGLALAEAAEEAGVAHETVRSWLRRHPAFAAEVERARTARAAAAVPPLLEHTRRRAVDGRAIARVALPKLEQLHAEGRSDAWQTKGRLDHADLGACTPRPLRASEARARKEEK